MTRWTARTALRRVHELTRREGIRSSWHGILAETIYRRLLLVELRLGPPPRLLAEPIPLETRFLATGELDAYRQLRPDQSVDEVLARLRAGDRCYIGRRDGLIVSARWIAEGAAWIDYLARRIELEPRDVYLYETFTRPDHRGLGISGAVGTRLARDLAAEGKRRILGAVLPENRAGVRAYEKAGYVKLGTIGFVRLGRFRRDFGRPG